MPKRAPIPRVDLTHAIAQFHLVGMAVRNYSRAACHPELSVWQYRAAEQRLPREHLQRSPAPTAARPAAELNEWELLLLQ